MLRRVVVLSAATLAATISVADAQVPRPSVDGFGRTTFRHYQRSRVTLRGTLYDGGGNPAYGVGVQVVVSPFDGEPSRTYGGTTRGDGGYVVRIPRGPSRLMTISAGGATREVKEIVSPGVWLTISTRGRGHVLFTGGVRVSRSAPIPTVLLQDHTPSGWQTFGAVNPNTSSHLWRFRYHASTEVIGRTFRFRATTLRNAAWARGYSTTKKATVR